MAEGVGETPGVELVTIDTNATLVERVAEADWPSWVRFEVGDALDLLAGHGCFDLVFDDAVAGKWYGLDLTIAAIAPGGLIVVDDMAPRSWASKDHEARTAEVRTALTDDVRLVAVEMS
jgi:predicted O-methyltransferase YrrM